MKLFEQDAADKLDYQVSITGDTVASATAAVTPNGPTLGVVATTATTAKVRVSGLTTGSRYTLTLHVVGASGQEWDRSCVIRAVDQ